MPRKFYPEESVPVVTVSVAQGTFAVPQSGLTVDQLTAEIFRETAVRPRMLRETDVQPVYGAYSVLNNDYWSLDDAAVLSVVGSTTPAVTETHTTAESIILAVTASRTDTHTQTDVSSLTQSGNTTPSVSDGFTFQDIASLSAGSDALIWEPPGYPSYAGYTTLNITNANKGTLASLSQTTDYKVNLLEDIAGTVHGTPAIQILGGRNVVVIGGHIYHSAFQQTTTLTGAISTTTQTLITVASSTGYAINDFVVVDPGNGTKSEAMQITGISGLNWTVTRNTGYAGSVGVAATHLVGATVKKVTPSTNWGLHIQDWTGILYVEGVLVDGTSLTQGIYQQVPSNTGIASEKSIICLQNCRFDAHADDVRNGNDAHADAWQIAEGPAEIRAYNCSFRSTSNALQWQPTQWDLNYSGAPAPRMWDVRKVDMRPSTFFSASTGYEDMRSAMYTNILSAGDWTNPKTSTRRGALYAGPEINFEDVYARTQPPPPDGNLTRYASVDNHEILATAIIEGYPAADFCPPGKAGSGYTSPGYQKPVHPTIFGMGRTRMSPDTIRGLTKRSTTSSTTVTRLAAWIQMANFRRQVLESTPLFYSRLRETTGTVVTEEPMWGWGNGASANVTLNSVSSPIADGGPAYSFNGTNAYFSKAFDLTTAGWWSVDQLMLSAFVYVNTPTAAATQTIFEFTPNYTTSDGGLAWQVSSAGNGRHVLSMRTAAGGTIWAEFAVSTTVGWHHLIAGFDRSVAPSGSAGTGAFRFYVDGTPVAPTNTSGSVALGGVFANSTLYAMSRAGTSLFTAGRMAEFAMFGRLMSNAEITALYAQSQEVSTGTAALRLAVYNDPITSANSLIALSDEVLVPGGQRGEYVPFPFASGLTLPNGPFWVGVYGGPGSSKAALACEPGTATDGGVKSLTGGSYPTAPTSITPDFYDSNAYMYEVLAASGAGGTTSTPSVSDTHTQTEAASVNTGTAKISTLVDPFTTSINATIWSTVGTVGVTSGRADITPQSWPYTQLYTNAEYDLAASQAVVEIPQIAGGETSMDTGFGLQPPGGDAVSGANLGFIVENGTLYLRYNTGTGNNDTVITYSATNHKWWRFREASGTIFWETSPDGSTWTTQRSVTTATYTPGISNLTLVLYAGWWSGATGFTPVHMLVEHVN